MRREYAMRSVEQAQSVLKARSVQEARSAELNKIEVSNQVTFNPPIGRLDQMYFQWLDNAGVQIDNFDCEWSASMTVTENKQIATTGSTLPRLPPMPFTRK